MNMDKSQRGPDGRLKNGVVKEYFKDGTLSCATRRLRGLWLRKS